MTCCLTAPVDCMHPRVVAVDSCYVRCCCIKQLLTLCAERAQHATPLAAVVTSHIDCSVTVIRSRYNKALTACAMPLCSMHGLPLEGRCNGTNI